MIWSAHFSSRVATAAECAWTLRALAVCAVMAVASPVPGLTQTQAKPRAPGTQTPGSQAAGNQTPPAPTNQTAAAPLPPPGIPLYVSPGIVKAIQMKLASLGYAVPSISGAWGDTSSAALAKFQAKHGLDAGGDLDELTLAALDLSPVLRGESPPGTSAPVDAQAAATGGAPIHASPRLARVVQNALTDAGFPTDNVFGIWMAGSEAAARAFQKARGLDITGTLDLRIVHALRLTSSLTDAKPGKLPTDNVAQILSDKAVIFTGVPLTIGPAGIRQVQTALQQRGHKDVVVDGRWSDAVSAALKKFQEANALDVTGSVNLVTLRALGFAAPLSIDQGAGTAPPPTIKAPR